MVGKPTYRELEERIRVLEEESARGEQAARALRESEAKYRRLAENMPGVVYQFLMSPDGTFSFPYINESLIAVAGICSDEAMRDSSVLIKIIPPEEMESFREGILESACSLRPYQATFSLLKDGHSIWIEARSTPERLPDGSTVWKGFFVDVTERKQEREALLKTQFAMDRAQDSITWIDDEGTIVYANDSTCASLGYTREELLAMKVFDIDPDFSPAGWEEHKETMRRQRSMIFETRHRAKGGRIFPVEVSTNYFEYNDRFLACAFDRDITERKRSEEEFREREGILRSLFEATPVGVALMKGQTFIQVNKSLCRIAGYSEEEMTGMRTCVLYHDEDEFRRVGKSLYKQMERDGAGTEETILRHKDGVPINVILNLSPFDPADHSAGICATVLDVTDRRKTEEELRRLSIAVEQAAEDIVITDEEGVIEYVNPAFEKITGFSRAEVLGQTPRILRSGVHGPSFYEHLWNTISGGDVWKGRITNRRKDGKLIHEDATISPLVTSSGKLTGYVALKRDITDAVRLEFHLRQKQKMEAIGAMAGGIAHDFNNIIGAMMGYAQLAKFKTTDVAMHNYMEQIVAACNRSRNLAQQILTFSRQREQEKKPVAVTPIVKEALTLLNSSLPATITIRQFFGARHDTVYADTTQIHQVLMNLCTNAVHAMNGREGVLDVSISEKMISTDNLSYDTELKEGPYLQLIVRDTGTGIDPVIKDKIFDPFFTTKKSGEGTGLGLSVVYGIVRDHGGIISCESEPGKGTVFEVALPLIDTKEEFSKEDADLIPMGTGRILYVDDEEPLGSLAREMLTSLGYTVTNRFSSHDALEAFRAQPERFDMVITDMIMPNMTGAGLASEILKIRPGLPIVLTTGFSEQVNEERVKKVGIREILMKPVSLPDLARAVKRIMSQEKPAAGS